MKNLLLLSVFIVFSFSIQLFADSEVEMIEKFLNSDYSQKTISTGKQIRKSKGIYDSYMKNPVYSIGLEKAFSDSAYSLKFAELGLEFDVSGKYFLRKKIAGFKKDLAQEELTGRAIAEVSNFRMLLAQLFYLTKKQKVLKVFTNKTGSLLKELNLLVEGKSYSKLDLMRVNMMFRVQNRKLLQVNSVISALKGKINEICGSVPTEIELTVPKLSNLEKTLERSMKEKPEVKKATANLQKDDRELRLAKRSIAPDLGLEFGFSKEKIPNLKPEYGIEVGISFELPVFNFNKKEIAQAQASISENKQSILTWKRFLKIRLTELHEEINSLKKGVRVTENKDEILDKSVLLYRKGGIPVGELISIFNEIQEMHFSDIELTQKIHFLTLEFYSEAGFFESDEINDLINGAVK